MKQDASTKKADKVEALEMIARHTFFIDDFTKQVKEETAELDKINKRIDKLKFDIGFHKGQITSIKTKRLFDYLHKCNKVLFTRPGLDWFKVMPFTFGINEQAIVIIRKPHLKAAIVEVMSVDTHADFTLKQWQRRLFYPYGSNTARAIKNSAELKQQFSVVSAIMTSNYTKTNNQPVIKMVESYLFCANNPHLKIG